MDQSKLPRAETSLPGHSISRIYWLTSSAVSVPLVAAAVAGTATAAAYVNAKWHITKDVSAVWNVKSGERSVKRAGTSPLLSHHTMNSGKYKLIDDSGQRPSKQLLPLWEHCSLPPRQDRNLVPRTHLHIPRIPRNRVSTRTLLSVYWCSARWAGGCVFDEQPRVHLHMACAYEYWSCARWDQL